LQPIVVHKYGGSSVADVDGIRRVARRVVAARESGKRVVVVVSAMGKTTDELLARARKISPSPSRRELDMLLTCGERASMALLSMAVGELGHEAISLTGSQSGILTNDRHSGARIIEVRPIRIQDALDDGTIVIVAGFQGVSYRREITTLGRGGSDATAVALAAALGAEACEICSDVDGVYSADPRVVSAAELLQAISHDEMLELATAGARVLHPESVEFARRSKIALYARATAGDGAGTRIDRPDATGGEGSVGVAGQKNLASVRAPARQLDAVLEAAAAAGLSLSLLSCAGDEAAGVLPLDDVPDWASVRRKLEAIPGVSLEAGVGAVSAVGLAVGGAAGPALRARAAAVAAGVTVTGVVITPLRLTLYCAEEAVDTLSVALHRALRESAG
jgi:aspartate kinase